MQEQLSRMLLVVTGPLEPEALLETRVGHPREHGREGPYLVPDLLRGRVAQVEPEPLGDLREDPQLVPRLARRIERLAHALDAPLAVRDRSLGLAPGGGGR